MIGFHENRPLGLQKLYQVNDTPGNNNICTRNAKETKPLSSRCTSNSNRDTYMLVSILKHEK